MRVPKIVFLALSGLIGVEAWTMMRRQSAPIPNKQAVARGCRDSLTGLDRTNPSWVSVRPGDTATVMEGTVLGSKVTFEDFPTNHESHDWNFFVKPAPGFEGMLSDAAETHSGQKVMECEWETKHFPDEFLPVMGDTAWMIGRFIFDCGHPPYRTEIHPPKGVAFTRAEPVAFAGDSVPSVANKTSIFFHAQGGYFYDPIGGRDYTFTVPLPPKPSASAVLKTEILSVPFGGIRPVLTPEPAANRVRVTFPLSGFRDPAPVRWNLYGNSLAARVKASQPRFGAVIASGWREPTTSRGFRVLRVTLDNVKVTDDHDPLASGEWVLRARVNGTWTAISGLGDVDSGDTVNIGKSFLVTVPDSGSVSVETTGWESDSVDDGFGIQSPGGIPSPGALDANDEIGNFLKSFGAGANFGVGSHDEASSSGDFRLRYHIDEVSRIAPGTPNGGGAPTIRKRVTVTFDQVKVLDDADPFGSGEIWFDFDVNGRKSRNPSSGARDIGSGDTRTLGNAISVDLNSTDTLRVFMKGTDEDSPDANDPLGEVVRNFDRTTNFGAGSYTIRSTKPDGQFEVTFRITVVDL